MFKIDRTHVNLSATRYIMVNKEITLPARETGEEAGAEGEMSELAQTPQDAPDAAASADSAASEAALEQALEQAQEIIEKAEAAAKDAADEITDAAREEAEGILREAREKAVEESAAARSQALEEGFNEGKADGQAKGYDEGFASGEEEGRKDFDEKIRLDDEKLQNVLSEIYKEIERANGEIENGVAGLALEIVKKVIDPSDAASGVFESLIRNALSQIRTDREIIIRLGQDECKRFFPSGNAEFVMDNGVTVKATVLEDKTLGEGDVVIDAGEETINAGLETQLRNVEIAFERADI